MFSPPTSLAAPTARGAAVLREPVVASPFVVFVRLRPLVALLDEPLVQQAPQQDVERAGPHHDDAFGEVPDREDHAVSMEWLLRQRKQHVVDAGRERKERSWFAWPTGACMHLASVRCVYNILMRFAGAEIPLSRLGGGRDIGVNLVTVPPGKQSCPMHYHVHEEEHFYIGEQIVYDDNLFRTAQTGTVAITTKWREGVGHGRRRLVNTLLDSEWTEPLPIYAFAIEHPEGVILVDTGLISVEVDERRALRWHANFWDPWFLLWGCALGVAMMATRIPRAAE